MSLNPAELLRIHTRLVARDPSASADLFTLVYGPLIGHALKKHGRFGVDREKAEDLALHALAGLIERPEQFDWAKASSLFGFLCMVVDGDAINANQTEKGRAKKLAEHTVEVLQVGGNSYSMSPEIRIDAQRIMDEHGSEIVTDEGDEAVLRLLLQEERDYGAYARALRLEHLPPKDRDAEVKRRKDKIETRLRRLGRRL